MRQATRQLALPRPSSATRRRAFSLSELMIAIVIFGVGMIMVAATFPVGIDQCRIVADESVTPLVADQAMVQLQFLLEDQRKLFNNNTQTFKEAIKALPADQLTNTFPPNVQSTPTSDINTIIGLDRRSYPSNSQADRLYTWSVLVGKDANTNYAEFIVFVSRKNDVADRLTRIWDENGDDIGGITIDNGAVTILDDDGNKVDFAESDYLAIDYGAISQVMASEKAWDPRPQQQKMVDMYLLREPGEAKNDQHGFWRVPAKGSESGSPVLNVYKFSFPLDY
jgi:prepilin-type N-terminal cleavage/methylation domain-containing protein